MNDDDNRYRGRIEGEQFEPERGDGIGMRLVYMVLIWFMISLANTVLGVATLVQFVLMLLNKGEANPRLAAFGEDLGIWMAKAARFQTGASEVKPWPWTELD